MKIHSRFQHNRKRRRHRSHQAASHSAGILSSCAAGCGIGTATGVGAALVLSLVALLCGFNGAVISALGYLAAAVSFAACGFAAGKLGRAALPTGMIAACGMTLITVLLSFLPFPSPSPLSPLINVLARLGFATLCVIFAVIGSNR